MVLMRIIIFALLLDPAATQPASDLTDKHLEIGNTALANSDSPRPSQTINHASTWTQIIAIA
jgi:hypothetical protein